MGQEMITQTKLWWVNAERLDRAAQPLRRPGSAALL